MVRWTEKEANELIKQLAAKRKVLANSKVEKPERKPKPKSPAYYRLEPSDIAPTPTICPTCGERYGPDGGGGRQQAKRRYVRQINGVDYEMFVCKCGKEYHRVTHTPVPKEKK